MKKTKDTSLKIFFYLLVSITINALGNGLTVSLNLGSALWTASAVNLEHLIHVDLKLILIYYGIAVIIFNAIILRKIEWRRIVNNFLFMIPFSFLVGYATNLFNHLNLDRLNIVIRIFLDCFGIVMISTGVSIYQRINILLHPNDDLMQIIRFKFFKGNSAIAMWVSLIPPIIISLICFLLTKRLYAVNVGTVFALAFQGILIGQADRFVFPSLKHRGLSKIKQPNTTR
ncbi:hypothetical protein [Xylocopilactobacillus apicola]|uniref:Sugar specific permease n=1 Tax=Xylocopilactobacillus apicola TaxID=2932184 RepID=A0AAU9DNP7_9LACO|nr:hypothetical protein [Xylocopilactobacillus apicola]BDR58722.1 hypothetical protein XA3_11630 [Xylocopilactobacillus apicola]